MNRYLMMFLYDFLIFYNAGKAVWAGLSPYSIPDFVSPYPLAVLFAPLALLPLPLAYALFVAFNGYMLWRLMRRRMIWALLSFPILFTLFVGQIDLALALGIGAVPWLLPLAMVKPQVGFVLAPWLLRRFSRQDWLKAVTVGTCLLAVSFMLRPGWAGEWLAAPFSMQSYTNRTSNLYYLIPREWGSLRLDLAYVLGGLSFIGAFFIKSKKIAWTTTHLLGPASNFYSAAVLAEWIGPWEMAVSYLAVILGGGAIHEGMPMYLVGLVILARSLPFAANIKEKFAFLNVLPRRH